MVSPAERRAATGHLVSTFVVSARWHNGYVESFNARLRGELLSCEIVDTLTGAMSC